MPAVNSPARNTAQYSMMATYTHTTHKTAILNNAPEIPNHMKISPQGHHRATAWYSANYRGTSQTTIEST
jgi:hypothetical protein